MAVIALISIFLIPTAVIPVMAASLDLVGNDGVRDTDISEYSILDRVLTGYVFHKQNGAYISKYATDINKNDVFKFEYQGTTVSFLPKSIYLQSAPQSDIKAVSVSAASTGDILTFPGMFGTGTIYQITDRNNLIKEELVLSANPYPTALHSDTFIFKHRFDYAGLTPYINGVVWDETPKTTSGQIIFKSGTSTYFSFAVPYAIDANNNQIILTYDISKNKQTGEMNIKLNVPMSFLNSAKYPVTIDPSLEQNAGSITLYGNVSYDYVNVTNGGIIYIAAKNATTNTGTLTLNVLYDVNIDSSSFIIGDSRGQPGGGATGNPVCNNINYGGNAGSGSGAGTSPGNDGGCGGRGGAGGASYGSSGSSGGASGQGDGGGSAGATYGTSSGYDIDMGSGGGGGGGAGHIGAGSAGNAGGAMLTINAGGAINIHGTVSANGGSGGAGGYQNTYYGGGGGGGASGGGILLNTSTNLNISSVTITATGGNGGAGGGSVGGDGGGSGGGGRVKIFYAYSITNTSSAVSAGSVYYEKTNAPPEIPTIINPTNNSVGYNETSLNMTWTVSTDPDSDPIGYHYQFSNDSAFTDLVYNLTTTDTYSGVKTIPANQQMFFRVRSYDAFAFSSWSPVVSIRDLALLTPVNGSGQNFQYPPMTDDVIFSWSATESSAINFNLVVAEDSEFYQVVHDSTFNGLTKTLSLPEGTYYWKVRPYYTETSTYGTFTPAWTFNLTADYNPSGLTGITGIVYSLVDGTQTPLSGATVYIRKETLNWSDSTVTGSNGYYLFENLTNNTVYSLYAKTEGYEDSVTEYITTIPGQRITKNILLNKCISGFNCFYNQHYVQFTVQNIWFTKYAGVTATVYKGSELTASDTKITGTDGSVNFLLIKDQPYRITFIKLNATAGISTSWVGHPSKTDYFIITDSSMGSWDTHGTDASENINITISTNIVGSIGYINASYSDALEQTNGLIFYLNKTIPGDANNQSILQTINAGANNTYNASFTLSDYSGQSYILTARINHGTYGVIRYSYGVAFPSLPSPLQNFDPVIILMLFIGFILFISGVFGQTTNSMGAGIIVALVWILGGIGIFSAANVGLNFYLGLTLASVVVLIMNINERSRSEGLP